MRKNLAATGASRFSALRKRLEQQAGRPVGRAFGTIQCLLRTTDGSHGSRPGPVSV